MQFCPWCMEKASWADRRNAADCKSSEEKPLGIWKKPVHPLNGILMISAPLLNCCPGLTGDRKNYRLCSDRHHLRWRYPCTGLQCSGLTGQEASAGSVPHRQAENVFSTRPRRWVSRCGQSAWKAITFVPLSPPSTSSLILPQVCVRTTFPSTPKRRPLSPG